MLKNNQFKICGLVLLFCAFLALPTYAEFTANERFFPGEWEEINWAYFGGCSMDSCFDTEAIDTYFVIGDYGVKQGVYSVRGPANEDGKGRINLQFEYKFLTENTSSDNNDLAVIKVKDVATDENYYYQTFTPTDGNSEEWIEVKVNLSDYIDKQLQLVFETTNDDADLSTLSINSINSNYASSPRITGTAYQTVAGKKFTASGVVIKLQNRKQTIIYQETTTDSNGEFAFFPVKRHRKFKVVAEIGDYQIVRKIRQLNWGEEVNKTFIFN